MPLPPALLSRLAKRGINVPKSEEKRPEKEKHVSVAQPHQPKQVGHSEEVEEVFAEDYDNEEPNILSVITTPSQEMQDGEKEEIPEGPLVWEVSACPNISNPYHECVEYCKNRWGNKSYDPDPAMLRKKERMLRKYPLPEGWEEVADPGRQRCYYWNTLTDEVSWLSPTHPRAKICATAEKLKDIVRAKEVKIIIDEKPKERPEEKMDVDDEFEFEALENEIQKEKKLRLKQRERYKGKRKAEDELDPMDPASYSDVPRGSWSSGLDQRGSAKTGVDVTATGPLFQQRPYPSPGDVLRANRKLQDD